MIKIRPYTPKDYEAVKSIYQEGIDTGNATFQKKAKEQKEWEEGTLSFSRLIAEEEGNVLGWAALSPVSSRCVYSGIAEVSVYIKKDVQGKGIGSALLHKIITISEEQGIWTIQAGIFPENSASIALHEKNGFRQVGIREKMGKMDGVWRDVVLLERRSSVVI